MGRNESCWRDESHTAQIQRQAGVAFHKGVGMSTRACGAGLVQGKSLFWLALFIFLPPSE